MDQTQDPRRRRRRRRRVVALFLFSMVLVPSVGLSVMSIALFTDSRSVASAFTTGTIILNHAKVDALVLTTSAMMPGDTVTHDVVIQNDGTAQFRYAMTSSSTNADAKALRDALTLTVKTIDVTTPATTCNDFDGASTLYNGPIGTTSAAFGDPTPGSQTGDRTLAAGTNETLCFRVSLPGSTGNGLQGATTTTTFAFDAEQTSSNP